MLMCVRSSVKMLKCPLFEPCMKAVPTHTATDASVQEQCNAQMLHSTFLGVATQTTAMKAFSVLWQLRCWLSLISWFAFHVRVCSCSFRVVTMQIPINMCEVTP